MSSEEDSRSGGVGCDCDETHGLALVEEVMRTIEQYNRAQAADPCPACLRDRMLAVAALLHLRAPCIGSVSLQPGANAVEAEFLEAARERLKEVTRIVTGSFAGLKQ